MPMPDHNIAIYANGWRTPLPGHTIIMRLALREWALPIDYLSGIKHLPDVFNELPRFAKTSIPCGLTRLDECPGRKGRRGSAPSPACV